MIWRNAYTLAIAALTWLAICALGYSSYVVISAP